MQLVKTVGNFAWVVHHKQRNAKHGLLSNASVQHASFVNKYW